MSKAIGLVIGAALVGAAIGLAASRRRSALAGWREDADRDFELSTVRQHDIEQRARDAGARGELTYIGAGAEGITLCDEHGHAFKIGHRSRGSSLRDEAEWLAMAGKVPSIKQHVPRGVRYDAENDVIVRECLAQRRGGNVNSDRLWKLHERLTKVMAPYGHGRPEFKVDAYVYTKRGPVLVDAGFAVKRGDKLVKEALDVANARIDATPTKIKELAWELRMERGETIPVEIANRLLRRLQTLEPSVEL